jgi:hypothetical protein
MILNLQTSNLIIDNHLPSLSFRTILIRYIIVLSLNILPSKMENHSIKTSHFKNKISSLFSSLIMGMGPASFSRHSRVHLYAMSNIRANADM